MSGITVDDIKRMAAEKTEIAINAKFSELVKEALASGQYVQADDAHFLIRRSDGQKIDVWQNARMSVLEGYAKQARAAGSAGKGAEAASIAASSAGQVQEQAQAQAVQVASEAAADIANAGVLAPAIPMLKNWVPITVIGVGGVLALYFIFRKPKARR